MGMSDQEMLHEQRASLGMAAVNGLFNGLLAGGMMALYVVLVVQVVVGGDWAYMNYLDILNRDPPNQAVLAHLAISAAYGVIYVLLLRWTHLDRQDVLPRWLAGMVY